MIIGRGLGRDSVDSENGNMSIYGMGLWFLVIVIPITPACRTFVIDQESRTLVIDQESRTLQVSCKTGGT